MRTFYLALLTYWLNISLTSATQPNVLFLVVDDLRAWTGCLNKGYPGEIFTPNIDQLAKQGRLFTNAHVPSPKCGPCRASVLTGQLPSQLGIYGNGQWLHPNHPNLTSLPKHFKQNGYHTVGAGKITHHTAGFNPPNEWHDFQEIEWEDPWDRPKSTYPNKTQRPAPEIYPISGLNQRHHELDWGSLPHTYEYHDPKTTNYAKHFLSNYQGNKPFFLACGIFRPHLPWYAPKEYFDLYPLDKIRIPLGLKPNDRDDLPPSAKRITHSKHFDLISQSAKYKQAIQAYLASISFADAQIGRVLTALKASKHHKNTIIVLWSDHGWHHGEKNHWHKWTLWENATQIPLIIAAPELPQPGISTDAPVSALSLYPTLVDLCRLPMPNQSFDEESLRPLLENPSAPWKHAVVIQHARGSCAVRSRNHRYILYANGDEELYDHTKDPYEWTNKAHEPSSKPVINKLKKFATTQWHDNVPSKNAFHFDPHSYTWKRKTN
ncbi:sulfatase [Rubritalea tangerina]|uniref:Sulfatase n=2 Tax=Rubritalea tangerina TaxID=430798 RepID=A0ABW4ZFS8_9BACT